MPGSLGSSSLGRSGSMPQPTLAHISLSSCSAAQAGLAGLLLSWLSRLQQHSLAQRESHSSLCRERLQVQPQPELLPPQCGGQSALSCSPAPAAGSWGSSPLCSLPQQASTSLVSLQTPCCPPPAAHSLPTQSLACAAHSLPPQHADPELSAAAATHSLPCCCPQLVSTSTQTELGLAGVALFCTCHTWLGWTLPSGHPLPVLLSPAP